MSKYRRYQMLKKCYPNCCILFLEKEKLKALGIDKEIIKSFKNIQSFINKRKVSYLIVENLEIVELNKVDFNKYCYYFYYCEIKLILDTFI